ncbi:MAG: isocitrate lyase/PEP mutase family protein [Chloroflexi bacterium]|nr:isocitrate lyase/PEP mutase family protein [Chloroflexota bacterium]
MALTNKEMTKKLREIFYRPGLTVVPGGSTPYHAIMTERAGYEAFYMSGAMTHNWLIGWPDAGAMTMREFADNGNRIVKCVNIPVFSDCDVGFGNAVNVYRTIKEYIWAGIAGCHIEDVEYPKGVVSSVQRPTGRGHDGELLISIEEAVGKYKAAVAARNELDPNFVIVARTDARLSIGGGYDEAIKRAKAYETAGVDVIMFEGMHSWEESARAMASVRLPSFCNTHIWAINRDAQGNWIPGPSLEQRAKDGEKIYLAVGLSLQVANQAAWEMLVEFKKRGMQAVHEWRLAQEKKTPEMRLPTDLIPIAPVRKLEQTYLPKTKEVLTAGP